MPSTSTGCWPTSSRTRTSPATSCSPTCSRRLRLLAQPRPWGVRRGLAGLLCLAAACARVSDPQPPNPTPPATIADLRLEQVENHMVLDFSLPAVLEDGQPLDLESVAVVRMALRRSASPPALAPEDLERDGQVIARLWPDDLAGLARAGRYRFTDVVAFPDPHWVFQRSFVYALRFYSRRGAASRFSNMAFLSPLAPAAAPGPPRARATAEGVLLEWDPPARNIDGSVPPRIVDYRILRGDTRGSLAGIAWAEADPPRYLDASAVEERTYYYAVQARSSEEPRSLGPRSPEAEVSTADVFPPAPPRGLAAVVSGSAVRLVWEPGMEEDLRGYNVYRSVGSGGFQKLNATPAEVSSYTDLPPRGEVRYRVTAVDARGNESAPSAEEGVAVQ